MPDELFWQKLALFFLLNVLEFVEPAVDKELNKNLDELVALYEKLKAKDMDYYELFNLKNSATANEIKDVYYQYAKKFHPDRLGEAPIPN